MAATRNPQDPLSPTAGATFHADLKQEPGGVRVWFRIMSGPQSAVVSIVEETERCANRQAAHLWLKHEAERREFAVIAWEDVYPLPPD